MCLDHICAGATLFDAFNPHTSSPEHLRKPKRTAVRRRVRKCQYDHGLARDSGAVDGVETTGMVSCFRLEWWYQIPISWSCSSLEHACGGSFTWLGHRGSMVDCIFRRVGTDTLEMPRMLICYTYPQCLLSLRIRSEATSYSRLQLHPAIQPFDSCDLLFRLASPLVILLDGHGCVWLNNDCVC